MVKATLKEKVSYLEAKLELLKDAIAQEPDFDIDERNWRRIKPTVTRIRKELFVRRYGKK